MAWSILIVLLVQRQGATLSRFALLRGQPLGGLELCCTAERRPFQRRHLQRGGIAGGDFRVASRGESVARRRAVEPLRSRAGSGRLRLRRLASPEAEAALPISAFRPRSALRLR